MRKKRVCLLANSESRVCNRISIVRVWRNALPDNSSGLGSYEEKFLACCYALGKIQALVSSFWFFFFFYLYVFSPAVSLELCCTWSRVGRKERQE